MKPKLKDNEGLYTLNIKNDDSLQHKRAIDYIKTVARWFAVRRAYRYHIEYMFVVDEEIESYLALAFNVSRDSTFEIRE